jgi:hypothetical protein
MIRSLAFGLVLFAIIAESAAAQPDSLPNSTALPDSLANTSVFHSEPARIEIHKPPTWHFADLQAVVKSSQSVRLDDEAFMEAVKRMAKRPLVSAAKHEASYAGLNPSFQVIVRAALNMEGKSGVEILEAYIPHLKPALTGFKVVKEPHAITVGGRPGGAMVVSYTMTTQSGQKVPGTSTFAMVPSGKVVYQFGFSSPIEGPDKLTGEIDDILASVKWLD